MVFLYRLNNGRIINLLNIESIGDIEVNVIESNADFVFQELFMSSDKLKYAYNYYFTIYYKDFSYDRIFSEYAWVTERILKSIKSKSPQFKQDRAQINEEREKIISAWDNALQEAYKKGNKKFRKNKLND